MISYQTSPNVTTMEAFIALRTCMLEQLERPNQDSEQIFEGFTKITDYCVVNTDVSRVVLDSVKNYDETKYFIKNNTVISFDHILRGAVQR
ncbi:unnamed protein product [Nippostrongylus brasiliensis]|uniref:Uncharacterized protein n=1 Tax=Nippostrongylus brasiliensis TaxID=27835 RepID=A0A0N4XL95_NIPBR|nr:unnamed protein product [Nippostrongylus brasiliensis]